MSDPIPAAQSRAANVVRVLLLSTYYHPILGGVESNARRLAVFLQRHGLPVQVLTKRVTSDLPDRDAVEGIPVRRIPPRGPRSGSGKWLMIPFALSWLVHHRREFDVICCIDFRGIGLAAIAAGRLLDRPVVVQAQTTGVVSCDNWDPLLERWHIRPTGAVARMLKRPLRAAYAAADGHACIARGTERETLNCGIDRGRVRYLPNAIDMTHFSVPTEAEAQRIRAAEGWPADKNVCLFLGRLSLEKGILDLLEAWRLVQRPNAVLVVVGPDMPGNAWDMGPAARQFVAEHGLAGSVIFHGPTSEPARLMRGADIFVQPSHFEALGLSAIEAMATGLATVASAVGGLLDFVEDEVTGLLSPARAPEALARQLQRLIDDPGLRRRLAMNGRARVERDFDEQAVFGRFAEWLRDLSVARRASRL